MTFIIITIIDLTKYVYNANDRYWYTLLIGMLTFGIIVRGGKMSTNGQSTGR